MAELYFEKELVEMRQKIKELMQSVDKKDSPELVRLRKKIWRKEKSIYSNLNSWQKTLLARHPQRPGTIDFIAHCVEGFFELHGDRHFADDGSVMGGMGAIDDISFMIIGHVKGKTTRENVMRNFGMPHPEGYRKVQRLMSLASDFNLPILTLIDTPGAYPGLHAEERGQSESIARCLYLSGDIKVPMIAVVIGEGGSGGALALGVANRILMLEHSIFGVISPEGCSSILWNDFKKVKQAAELLKYTAQDLKEYGIIEEIISEPQNGAHNQPQLALADVKKTILNHYNQLSKLSPEELIKQRFEKFRNIGVYAE